MLNKKLIKPAIFSFLAYLFSYQIPKHLIDENTVHFIKLPIDDMIPLIKPFVIIYLLAFIQWGLFMITLAKQDTKTGYKYASALSIASFIGFIILLIYPTGTQRPEIVGNGVLDFMLKVTYNFDNPVNAMPSFHCLYSWIVYRGLSEFKGIDKKWLAFNLIFSILVFASTIFVKQHFFIDIPTGILLAEIGIQIAKKYPLTKPFNRLNKIGE